MRKNCGRSSVIVDFSTRPENIAVCIRRSCAVTASKRQCFGFSTALLRWNRTYRTPPFRWQVIVRLHDAFKAPRMASFQSIFTFREPVNFCHEVGTWRWIESRCHQFVFFRQSPYRERCRLQFLITLRRMHRTPRAVSCS